MSDATERDFREWLRALTKQIGAELYFTQRSDRSPAGWPDVQIVYRRRLFIAELKRDRDVRGAHLSPTPEQKRWLDAFSVVDRPPVTALWRPGDLEGIAKSLVDVNAPTPGVWRPGVGRDDETG